MQAANIRGRRGVAHTFMFTGLLIAMLIIAGAATVVGGGLMLASQRRRLPEAESYRLLGSGAGGGDRSLRELRVGDVIQYVGRDFLVEGVIVFDEDGHRWNAARVVDGREVRWLVAGIERAGSGKARVLEHVPEIDLSGYPPETLVAGGIRYVLDKRGTATAKVYGEAGEVADSTSSPTDSVLRCRWWRYESPGDETLLVEQWGDSYRTLAGKIAAPGELELIPGS